MLIFSANLTMMFTEVPFLDRFDCAAAAGFRAVEFLFPYEYPAAEIGRRLRANGLHQALFNLPPGDWNAGERGLACISSRLTDVLAGIDVAMPYVHATGVRRLHIMSGIGEIQNPEHCDAYRIAVEIVANRLATEGIDLLIEPINNRDMPSYFLNDFEFARKLITDLGLSNLKLQYDFYHRQILRGDVVESLTRFLPLVGHVQVASVPDRHEPDHGELNWPFLFEELDRLGYSGYVGCEYRPAGHTLDGLGWFEKWKGSTR